MMESQKMDAAGPAQQQAKLGGGEDAVGQQQPENALTSLVRRLPMGALAQSLPALSNPLPHVSSVKSFVAQLKKEAPKVLDVRAYSKPVNMQQVSTRVRANTSFFRVTYAAVMGAIVVITVLSSPMLFIALVSVLGLWLAFMRAGPDDVLKVGTIELKRNEKLLILVTLTLLIVVFGGLISSLFYIAFLSGAVVGSHAAFHEVVELDALEVLEKEGEAIVQGDMV